MTEDAPDEIAALDRELLALLERRALAVQVAAGVAQPSELSAERAHAIWREVRSACDALVAPTRVAYLGPAGTFSELAALALFGSSMEAVCCASLDEVFRATSAGAAHVGVVPIENSTEGMVARSLDLLRTSDTLRIVAETHLPVAHALLRRVATRDGITTVCAHPQALAQCHGWLQQHLPDVELRPVSSNAEGARLASLDASLAGIASEHAVRDLALCVVASAIQDEPNNRTRFVVIADHGRRAAPNPSSNDRTSLIVSVPNRPGAMHDLLVPLKRHGVSMSKLESRPARTAEAWAYYFYIDIEGHGEVEPVKTALDELHQLCTFWRFLGSYPISGPEVRP